MMVLGMLHLSLPQTHYSLISLSSACIEFDLGEDERNRQVDQVTSRNIVQRLVRAEEVQGGYASCDETKICKS